MQKTVNQKKNVLITVVALICLVAVLLFAASVSTPVSGAETSEASGGIEEIPEGTIEETPEELPEEILPEPLPEELEETPPLAYTPYEEKTGDFAQLSSRQSEPFAIGDHYTAVIENVRFATEEEALMFLPSFEMEAGKGHTKGVVVSITVTKNDDAESHAEISALELSVCGFQGSLSKYGYFCLNEDPDTTLLEGESKTFQIPYVMRDTSFSAQEWENFAQQEFCLVCPYEQMKYSASNETLRIPFTIE